MPITRVAATTQKTSPLELATLALMRPGAAVPGMRRTSTAIASTNTAAQTQLLAAPTGNTKHLVKSVVITNPTNASIAVTVAGQGSGAWGLLNGAPIAAQSSMSLPLALVLNNGGGVGLFAAASAAGLIATVNYVPLDAAENIVQWCLAYGLQGGAARSDIIVPGPPAVITSILVGATSGGAVQPVWYGLGGTHVADLVIPIGGLAVIDDPLYLNPGDTFSAQNMGAAGNWVSITACGYLAYS